MAERGGRARRIFVWGGVAIGFVLALAVAPTLLTSTVAARLTARTGVPVAIAWISWNPFAGRISLHDVRLAATPDDPPIITIGDVQVGIALRSLLAGTLRVDQLVLVDPWVGLRRMPGGDFNVSTLFQAAAAAPSPSPRATPAAVVREDASTLAIRRLRIEGGTVQFRDETTAPVLETSLYLEDIIADDLAVALSGTTAVTLHLESRLEREPLTLDLSYRAQAGDSTLRVRLRTAGASLARTLLYVPLGWQQVSGTLDVALDYVREIVQGRLAAHTLTAAATLHDVALAEPWAPGPTVRAARVHVPALVVDFVRQRTDLGTIGMEDFHAEIARDERGLHVPLVNAARTGSETRWRTVLSAVKLGAGELLLDRVVPGAEPEITARVRAGVIRQSADNLFFRLDTECAGGRVTVDGRVASEVTRMRFDLDGLALPEVSRRLRLPVGFATGSVDGSLHARFGAGPARFSGTLSIPGAKSVPPARSDDGEVFAWHDLTVQLADSTLDPLAIHVARAEAGWPYLMIHRGPGGVFPFGHLASDMGGASRRAGSGATTGATGEATSSGTGPVLRVDEGHAHGGRVEFYDTTLAAPYWTELAEIDLSLQRLAVRPFVTERFELRGALDWISPLDARGTIGTRASNLRAQTDRLRLAPLHPYLEPALGYRITSGLGRIDATIAIEDTTLVADSDLVLSRFAMSRTGDEPFERALGMPLSVALALMKDYRGDIRLPLTVRGDLTAQRYETGNVLLTGIREALVGTLRAPLTLFASVFRREEPERFDLQPVPFAPGSAALVPEGEERIAALARLLARHATLRAVLIPDPSPADATFFRDERLIARLQAGARGPLDDAMLTFLRARHAGASPAPLTAEAAHALETLAAAVPPPLERLKELADARAALVVRRLTEEHGVAAGRVSRTPWKPSEPRPETTVGVDLQLRGE